ncbi:hypothetical protein UR09_02970 [Candidatus Nitromaritima sp. SCGC AAA799-A02]|nr:hypothetical protein UR09_02970 [Candidatus Nitromaritima sp. SCGC AAA799-A02]
MQKTKFQFLTGIFIFLISFSALFFTLEDPGITLDEPYANRKAAISFVAWLELAKDNIKKGDWDHFSSPEVIAEYFKQEYTYHPPLARLWTGITWKLFHSSLGEIRSLRLAPALLFSISVTLLFFLLCAHYGLYPSLLASIGLLLIPHAFGHAHLIALDSPIASMWMITAFCFVKGLKSNRWAIMFGVVLGLTMNTKIHGIAVPFPLFLWGLLFFRKQMTANIWACVIFTPLTIYLTNPLYWHYPMREFVDYIANMMDKRTYEKIPTSFLGKEYGFSPPKYYAPFMIAVTTPPLMLIFSLTGMIYAGIHVIRRKLTSPPGENLDVFLLFNFLMMLILTLFKNIPLYDGVRLFLPAFPFAAGLAGSGLFFISQSINKKNLKSIFCAGMTCLILVFSAVSIIRIHPFELSYFNRFIGGLPGAKEWGLEPTYWNDAFTISTARLMRDKYPGKVFSKRSGVEVAFYYYKETGILGDTITQSKIDYDYYLLQHRLGWFEPKSWFYYLYLNPEHSIRREGVPLFEIYKSTKTIKKERSDFKAIKNLDPGNSSHFEWNKYLIVRKTGRYRLGILTGNLIKLWIDYDLIKEVPLNYRNIREYQVFLKKGIHTLQLRFPHSSKPPEFIPAWITPGGTKEVIPSKLLLSMDELQVP